eukprot:1039098-Prorocentrum_minimum.AAC.3
MPYGSTMAVSRQSTVTDPFATELQRIPPRPRFDLGDGRCEIQVPSALLCAMLQHDPFQCVHQIQAIPCAALRLAYRVKVDDMWEAMRYIDADTGIQSPQGTLSC